jgi:hypothetical protein
MLELMWEGRMGLNDKCLDIFSSWTKEYSFQQIFLLSSGVMKYFWPFNFQGMNTSQKSFDNDSNSKIENKYSPDTSKFVDPSFRIDH